LTVAGIVAGVRNQGLDKEPMPELYLPHAQHPVGGMTLVARTAADPLSLATAIRHEIWAVDQNQPIDEVKTMERLLADQIAGVRVFVWVLSVFAGAALLLAAVGIYGLMSYAVNQRTHEIGVRMALGARPSDVLRLVLRQGLSIALVGVMIGLAAALALTRLMTGLLFGVSPADPATSVGISLLLTGVVLLATYIPARRATKVDPMIALRHE
jgi:putative ABC transport system permease protein